MTGEKYSNHLMTKLNFCSSNCLREKLLNKEEQLELLKAIKIFGREIINDVVSTELVNILSWHVVLSSSIFKVKLSWKYLQKLTRFKDDLMHFIKLILKIKMFCKISNQTLNVGFKIINNIFKTSNTLMKTSETPCRDK